MLDNRRVCSNKILDPIVQDQLRHLYEHPDFVEMYPGIVVEDAKEAMDPGG